MFAIPTRRELAALLCLSCLDGCPTPLDPPTAVISSGPAGEDGGTCEAIDELTTAVDVAPPLYAGCSFDPSERHLTYHWAFVDQPNGAKPRIRDPEVASPTLELERPGEYRLELIVSNGTLSSAPAFAKLIVSKCGAHAPDITSIACQPRVAVVGQPLALTPHIQDLDAAPGCARDEPAMRAYHWTFVVLPVGSQARFNASSAEAPSFVPDVAGEYGARLEVRDATGRGSTASVRCTVSP